MKFVLASHNKKKLKELADILNKFGVEIEALPENAPEPEENGKTFAENAKIKAVSAMEFTGLPAIADDSGLCVEALGGAPSIYSARYCEGTDADRNALLLKNMQGKENRKCYFACAICCAFPNGTFIESFGKCEGEVLQSEQGTGGFGYDPIFYVPEYKCTFGELSPQIKNEISHRAVALREFTKKLNNYLQE
ncbi:MAG TPA: RdgB/HAM1 family non-canonical purine NTP pyrophosphatase [Candidatus Butyricicoccus avistercoris]|uniref:dITP/XTP pyrophosphatase n=1 Tax=Candidatus Butyricicoccus avistercoris TaxID=2838518 RepID=A0A9D1PGI0_9FIRM|nr:RdgB/HAM1 family non-canonical purine NTP pyrophosphatase [Candidatus Butyricicoccus avistercoris]